MVALIQNAKQVAFKSREPLRVRGSDRACRWDTTGIFMFSELDKSLDNCFYVYSSDELSAAGKLKIGSRKARRGANPPATFVDVDVTAGIVDVSPVPLR
jgi:hypothetical protein